MTIKLKQNYTKNIVFFLSFFFFYNNRDIDFKSETVLNYKCTLIGNQCTFLLCSIQIPLMNSLTFETIFFPRDHMLISFVNLYIRRHTRSSGRVLMYCLATFEFVLVVFLMFPFLINVEWRFNSEDWTHKTIIAVKMSNASSHSTLC